MKNPRYDLAFEGNRNLLYNLRFKFELLKTVDDRTLLQRYDDWGLMGFNDESEGMLDYLRTGE